MFYQRNEYTCVQYDHVNGCWSFLCLLAWYVYKDIPAYFTAFIYLQTSIVDLEILLFMCLIQMKLFALLNDKYNRAELLS